MLNEFKISCFLCVAETLNFTEAGRRLYISQQAVSRHIANLEEDLGVRLLERSRNSVELTSAGELFYRFFRDADIRYKSILNEVRESNLYRSANIHIGYQNWLDLGPALGLAMSALRERLPDLHLLGERHSPAALISLLTNSALDMILVHGRFIPEHTGIKKLMLIETPMQIVVSRNDPLCGNNTDYRAFSGRPLIIDALEGENTASTTERARRELAPYDFTPKEIIVVPNRDTVYTEAELGRGVFLSSAMSQTANSGALVRYDTDVMEGLFCLWHDGNKKNHIDQFAKRLGQEYGKLSAYFNANRKWPE